MKTIVINKKEYLCPENWKDVSVRMQIKAESISDTQTYVKNLGILSAYINMPIEELRTADILEVKQALECLDFIDITVEAQPVFEFEYKDNKYSVADTIMKQEFQDWLSSQTAIAEYRDNNWKLLTYLLATMAKRDGEKLSDYDVNERAEHFMDIDVQTIKSVGAFFLSKKQALDVIMMYCLPEARQEILQSKLRELINTVNKLKKQRGGKWHIRLWIGVMRLSIRYYTRLLQKYFNSQV